MPIAPCLPGLSFTEATITTFNGAMLRHNGSVKMLCEMIDDCDVKVI